jgi:hypothetical protein
MISNGFTRIVARVGGGIEVAPGAAAFRNVWSDGREENHS